MARKSNSIDLDGNDEVTGTKTCTKCGVEQETSTERGAGDFYKDRSQKDGYATWCKSCEQAYNKAYHAGLKAADASKKIAIADEAGLEAYEAELAGERVTRGWYKKNPKRAAAKKATVTRAKARTVKAATTGKAPVTRKRTTRSRKSVATEAGLTKAEQIDMGLING